MVFVEVGSVCWRWIGGRRVADGKGEVPLIDTLRINVYMLVIDRCTTDSV